MAVANSAWPKVCDSSIAMFATQPTSNAMSGQLRRAWRVSRAVALSNAPSAARAPRVTGAGLNCTACDVDSSTSVAPRAPAGSRNENHR